MRKVLATPCLDFAPEIETWRQFSGCPPLLHGEHFQFAAVPETHEVELVQRQQRGGGGMRVTK